MTARKPYNASVLSAIKIIGGLLLFFFLSNTAFAQNTKGDKPLGNQRQVRGTKAKSVKKKEKGKTKDIAGRRLRTKDKSSASRANSNHPQPSPYSGRKKTSSDRAASPRGRTFSNTPRESRTRGWTGDISGHKIRTVKPSKSGVARHNVYPQTGPYVNNPSKKPRKPDSRKTIGRTANGKAVVNRSPQRKQRAWKGNLRGGAIGAPSATGSVRNVFSQKNQYSRYTGKMPKQKSHSNASIAGRNLRLSSEPGPRGKKFSILPRSISRPFVKGGKKNPYWGKYSKGERAFTRDLSGAPLRTRNFRSMPAGLVGRDTLKTFGRKPGGDRAYSGRRGRSVSATPSVQRGWRGDLAGRRIRSPKQGRTNEVAGRFIFPRKMSISAKSHPGKGLPGAGHSTRSNKRRDNSPLPPRTPGMGASGIEKRLSKTTGRKSLKGGGSVSTGGWNNNRSAIDPRIPTKGSLRALRFSGNAKGSRPDKGGGSVSGKLWNNKNQAISPREPGQGSVRAGRFSGNIKGGRPEKGGGSVSGKLWNNKNQAISPREPGQGSVRAGRFSGNIKGGRPEKGGGSVSGKLWNNKNKAISSREPGQGSIRAGRFAGNIKGERPEKGGGSVSGKLWNNKNKAISPREPGQGSIRAGRFAGNIKGERPEKGGGSVSGKLWNNKEHAIDPREPGQGSIRAGRFAGNIKSKRPEKGGGSISGKLWNNKEQPIEVRTPKADDAKAAGYAGKMKIRRGYTQNDKAHDKSILKQKPEENTYLVNGLQVKVKRGKYEDKPKAADGSLPGIGPTQGTVKASKFGGDLKVSRNYKHNPKSHDDALNGVPPTKESVRASEYSRSLKMYWSYKHNPASADEALKVRAPKKEWERATTFAGRTRLTKSYKHNPHSADEALRVLSPGKAYAKIGNYQGNIKMHKFNDKRLHPDAQFAHTHRDNVKGERTILMDVKLFWAKLFKKEDTQPENLKDRSHRPRYDKGEKGLWADDPRYVKKPKAEQ